MNAEWTEKRIMALRDCLLQEANMLQNGKRLRNINYRNIAFKLNRMIPSFDISVQSVRYKKNSLSATFKKIHEIASETNVSFNPETYHLQMSNEVYDQIRQRERQKPSYKFFTSIRINEPYGNVLLKSLEPVFLAQSHQFIRNTQENIIPDPAEIHREERDCSYEEDTSITLRDEDILRNPITEFKVQEESLSYPMPPSLNHFTGQIERNKLGSRSSDNNGKQMPLHSNELIEFNSRIQKLYNRKLISKEVIEKYVVLTIANSETEMIIYYNLKNKLVFEDDFLALAFKQLIECINAAGSSAFN